MLYFNRPKPFFLSALGLLLAILFFLGVVFLASGLGDLNQTNTSFDADQFVNKFVVKAEKKNYLIVSFNMAEVFNRDSSLKSVTNMAPNPWLVREFVPQLKAINSCSEVLPPYQGKKSKIFEKLKIEFQVFCKDQEVSEDWLFSGPLIHPLGGTWLKRILEREKSNLNREKTNSFLHVGELDFFQGWSLDSLRAILNGEALIFEGEQVYVQTSTLNNQSQFLRIPIQDFITTTERLPLQFVRGDSQECLAHLSTGCFLENRTFLQKYHMELLLFCLIAFVLLLLLFSYQSFRDKKRAEELLKISAMAVNHEIRHPVAVLKLILDRWRSQWDKMDESFQDDFIKVFKEVGRLQQLTESADFFLRDQAKKEIQWNIEKIPSIKEWGQAIASDFEVDFKFKGADVSFASDFFWVSVAVENLIKNAKKYAHPPIELIMSVESGRLRVEVLDSGPLAPEVKSASGLGFGHLMVDKISRFMGGSGINVSKQKNAYGFEVREMIDEEYPLS